MEEQVGRQLLRASASLEPQRVSEEITQDCQSEEFSLGGAPGTGLEIGAAAGAKVGAFTGARDGSFTGGGVEMSSGAEVTTSTAGGDIGMSNGADVTTSTGAVDVGASTS